MTIFFDLDDTLYDRGLPFIAAAEEFFHHAITDPRAAYRACSRRSNEVFPASQRGEISMDEMYIYRWGKGFADVGVRITPEEALAFQQLYHRKQGEISLSPVLEAMLHEAALAGTPLGVITNGTKEKQWKKVDCLGLRRFMVPEMIIVSGEVGIDKPDPAVFRLTQQRSGKAPGDLLFVGDSLPNDIAPAIACGWHALWFNPDGHPIPADIHPDAIADTEAALAAALRRFF